MLVVAICQEFGWTYQEYMNQPITFIALIKEKMSIDTQKSAEKPHKGGKI